MYIIDEYQLYRADDSLYLGNYGIGAKISNQKLAQILEKLQEQPQLEISNNQLENLATSFEVSSEQLKDLLINKLKVLQANSTRKFQKIIINSDDSIITEYLKDALINEYRVECNSTLKIQEAKKSLVIFYRTNYSHQDFKKLYNALEDDVYIITAGIIHKILVIDNFYYKNSGLPTHFSNLNNLLACIHNDVSIPKNNWLLFYRQLMKNNAEQLPDPQVNLCQRGYAAYAIQKFVSQFTSFWKLPTPLDEVNWFWNVDLTSFSVQKEVAIHSPFSEYDMKLERVSETDCEMSI